MLCFAKKQIFINHMKCILHAADLPEVSMMQKQQKGHCVQTASRQTGALMSAIRRERDLSQLLIGLSLTAAAFFGADPCAAAEVNLSRVDAKLISALQASASGRCGDASEVTHTNPNA